MTLPLGLLLRPSHKENNKQALAPPQRWPDGVYENIAVADLIAATFGNKMPSEEEVSAAFRFYRGDQWPSEALWQRQKDDRPALVVNRLPALLATVLGNSGRAGYTVGIVEMQRAVVAIVRQNRDAQMAYNYLRSAEAERAALPPFRAMAGI